MMSTEQRLAYMADQIARNFAPMGAAPAVAATADHIATFWDPRMKQRAFALLDRERPDWLSELAERSLRHLRDRGAPASQTPATHFAEAAEVGLSDAG
jgi:formate dehydrogenase subunit delta